MWDEGSDWIEHQLLNLTPPLNLSLIEFATHWNCHISANHPSICNWGANSMNLDLVLNSVHAPYSRSDRQSYRSRIKFNASRSPAETDLLTSAGRSFENSDWKLVNFGYFRTIWPFHGRRLEPRRDSWCISRPGRQILSTFCEYEENRCGGSCYGNQNDPWEWSVVFNRKIKSYECGKGTDKVRFLYLLDPRYDP